MQQQYQRQQGFAGFQQQRQQGFNGIPLQNLNATMGQQRDGGMMGQQRAGGVMVQQNAGGMMGQPPVFGGTGPPPMDGGVMGQQRAGGMMGQQRGGRKMGPPPMAGGTIAEQRADGLMGPPPMVGGYTDPLLSEDRAYISPVMTSMDQQATASGFPDQMMAQATTRQQGFQPRGKPRSQQGNFAATSTTGGFMDPMTSPQGFQQRGGQGGFAAMTNTGSFVNPMTRGFPSQQSPQYFQQRGQQGGFAAMTNIGGFVDPMTMGFPGQQRMAAGGGFTGGFPGGLPGGFMGQRRGGKGKKGKGKMGGGAAQDFSGEGPWAAPLLGTVGFTTVDGQVTIGVASPSSLPAGEDIYGPFEAGFSSMQNFILEGLGCSDGELGHVAGGIDTATAEKMVATQCGIILPRTDANGLRVSLLDECGGHTREYHFHERLRCLYTDDVSHSPKLGEGNDGKAIYGKYEGSYQVPLLDACGGHWGSTPESKVEMVYHYHVQDQAPFIIGCYGPNDDQSLVTVEQCRELYPGCNGQPTFLSTGVNYEHWCPCFDGMGSNSGTAPLPVFSQSISA
jgi:hypothetical protein